MEHRCSKRKPIQHNVVVDSPGLGLTSADIGDISVGGMFVQTDGLNFPLDAPVFVAFDIPAGTDHDDFGLEAMVVRRTTSGVGLMFLEMETGIRRALQSALYGMPTFSPA
jgi:c-di-GMP-binding flagellar brake protein YcgR